MRDEFTRRQILELGGMATFGALLAGCAPSTAATPAPSGGGPAQVNPNEEYVFLSIVTQVPFWVDHKAALADAGALLGVKTTFTGPPDYDVAGQAKQLDELVARKPAAIAVFPGDADTMTPGINRAIEAGIPVVAINSDAPKSKRYMFLGIDGVDGGKKSGELLGQAIGGKGKVVLAVFPSPNGNDRVTGCKQILAQNYPAIQVVDVLNDQADPSKAPGVFAAAIAAHPDLAGIAGFDGDSGKGAAIAVTEAGKKGQIKIIAFDRNDDMMDYIDNGTITASVIQKSYIEMFLGIMGLYWLNHGMIKMVPDWKAANVNPLPEQVLTGCMAMTKDNTSQFRHKK